MRRKQVPTSPKARKSRQTAISNATDGRSLRATGRTEHLNFKATREMVDEAAKTLGIPKSLWLEQVIHEAHKTLKGGKGA